MIEKTTLDIAIIGGGPGGYSAALTAARLEAGVALIEKEKLGGTCLNVGCIPTKALNRCAGAYHEVKNSVSYGVLVDNSRFDLSLAMKFKNQVVSRLTAGVSYLLKSGGVEVIKGEGRLVSPNRVRIASHDGEREIEAKNIIVAAGAREIAIPGFEIDGTTVINSTQALSLNKLPRSLAIIGGGVIGVEFASFFNRMGVKVTLVELSPYLIPNEDIEICESLKKSLVNSGVAVFTGSTAKGWAHDSNGEGVVLKIRLADSSAKELACDKILVCVGRKADLEKTGLVELGATLEQGRVITDNRMRTNIESVYAIGDITSSEQLAHVAYHEARTAVLNIMGFPCTVDYSAVPHCIFSTPEVSSVGLTEKQARGKYGNIRIARFPFVGNGKALIDGETEGFIKMIAKESGQILGVSILGPKAAELIAEPTLAVRKELTVSDLAETIHAHPTLSEVISEVSLVALGLNLHS